MEFESWRILMRPRKVSFKFGFEGLAKKLESLPGQLVGLLGFLAVSIFCDFERVLQQQSFLGHFILVGHVLSLSGQRVETVISTQLLLKGG
jgi:hypothetical protein